MLRWQQIEWRLPILDFSLVTNYYAICLDEVAIQRDEKNKNFSRINRFISYYTIITTPRPLSNDMVGNKPDFWVNTGFIGRTYFQITIPVQTNKANNNLIRVSCAYTYTYRANAHILNIPSQTAFVASTYVSRNHLLSSRKSKIIK